MLGASVPRSQQAARLAQVSLWLTAACPEALWEGKAGPGWRGPWGSRFCWKRALSGFGLVESKPLSAGVLSSVCPLPRRHDRRFVLFCDGVGAEAQCVSFGKQPEVRHRGFCHVLQSLAQRSAQRRCSRHPRRCMRESKRGRCGLSDVHGISSETLVWLSALPLGSLQYERAPWPCRSRFLNCKMGTIVLASRGCCGDSVLRAGLGTGGSSRQLGLGSSACNLDDSEFWGEP